MKGFSSSSLAFSGGGGWNTGRENSGKGIRKTREGPETLRTERNPEKLTNEKCLVAGKAEDLQK